MAPEPSDSDGHSAPSPDLRERLLRFVDRAQQRVIRARSSFLVHGVAFTSVNALLLIINLVASPGFLWFLIPLGAWAIGLLHHYTELRTRVLDARDAAALPPVTNRTLRAALKLFANRRGLLHHLSATVAVSVCMAAINIAFPNSGPWSPWLLVGPLVWLGIHYASTREDRRRLLARLWKAGVDFGTELAPPLDDEPAEAGGALLARAVDLRDAVLAELRSGGQESSQWRSVLQPELDTYIDAIRTLVRSRTELERAATRVSAEEVTRELHDLRGKAEGTNSEDLKRQYLALIDQYEAQLRSQRDLQERAEMIDMRAKSAVLALKQLALDIPRLSAAPSRESAALISLRDKTREMTQYIDDLRSAGREIEQFSAPDTASRTRPPTETV